MYDMIIAAPIRSLIDWLVADWLTSCHNDLTFVINLITYLKFMKLDKFEFLESLEILK